MESNKPFSCLAISNPEFPEIKLRVIVCSKHQANENGANPFRKDRTNLFNYEDLDGLNQGEETFEDNYVQTPAKPCHEANLYIIFTNHNY